jgi:hypothetical protein
MTFFVSKKCCFNLRQVKKKFQMTRLTTTHYLQPSIKKKMTALMSHSSLEKKELKIRPLLQPRKEMA